VKTTNNRSGCQSRPTVEKHKDTIASLVNASSPPGHADLADMVCPKLILCTECCSVNWFVCLAAIVDFFDNCLHQLKPVVKP